MTISNTSAGGLHRSAHGNDRESRLACAGVRDRWDCADVQRAGTGAECWNDCGGSYHCVEKAGMGTTYLTLRRVWYGNGWDWCTDDRCIAGGGPVSVLAADDDTES